MSISLSRDKAITLVLIAGVLIIWESIVKINEVPVYIVPAPSRVLSTLFDNLDYFGEALLVTVSEAVIGLMLGATIGIVLASILSLQPNLQRGVMTLAVFIKSIPLVAIAPLLTIWFGFGVVPKIILTGLLTFFPVLINVFSGLSRADSTLLDTLKSWNASRWEIFWYVRVPGALPYLFAALKISGPLSLIGAVVAEWTGASQGIGKAMWLAYNNLNMPYLFAAIFILSFVGQIMYSIILWCEKRAVFWQSVTDV